MNSLKGINKPLQKACMKFKNKRHKQFHVNSLAVSKFHISCEKGEADSGYRETVGTKG